MESIKDAIFKFLRVDGLVDSLSKYVEIRVELIKLEMREEVAKIISKGLMLLLLLFLALLFLVFLSFALANYFNHIFDNPYTGYLLVALVYGILGLLIFVFRKKISHYFVYTLSEQSKKNN